MKTILSTGMASVGVIATYTAALTNELWIMPPAIIMILIMLAGILSDI